MIVICPDSVGVVLPSSSPKWSHIAFVRPRDKWIYIPYNLKNNQCEVSQLNLFCKGVKPKKACCHSIFSCEKQPRKFWVSHRGTFYRCLFWPLQSREYNYAIFAICTSAWAWNICSNEVSALAHLFALIVSMILLSSMPCWPLVPSTAHSFIPNLWALRLRPAFLISEGSAFELK